MRKSTKLGKVHTLTRRGERAAKSARVFLFLMDDRAPIMARR